MASSGGYFSRRGPEVGSVRRSVGHARRTRPRGSARGQNPAVQQRQGVGNRAAGSSRRVEACVCSANDGRPGHGKGKGKKGTPQKNGFVAGAHERADRRRRRVEVRDLVLVDDAPEAARVGPRRHALEDDLRRAVQQGPVGDVGVARDPAAVLRGRVPRRWRWGRGVAAGRAPSSKRKGKGRRKLTAVQNQTSSARVGASKTVRNEWPAPTM